MTVRLADKMNLSPLCSLPIWPTFLFGHHEGKSEKEDLFFVKEEIKSRQRHL